MKARSGNVPSQPLHYRPEAVHSLGSIMLPEQCRRSMKTEGSMFPHDVVA
jgi:hypothetical protein